MIGNRDDGELRKKNEAGSPGGGEKKTSEGLRERMSGTGEPGKGNVSLDDELRSELKDRNDQLRGRWKDASGRSDKTNRK